MPSAADGILREEPNTMNPWRPHLLRRGPRLAVLALALLVTACTSVPGIAIARSTPDSFSPLVKRVLPSVVNIAVTETVSGGDVLNELPPELRDTPLGREFRRRFGNRKEQTIGAGSGFIIDPSGLIVTNNHVVGHADKIVVALTDGTRLPAQVIGTDELTDVALIKVQATGPLPCRHLGRFAPGGGRRLGARRRQSVRSGRIGHRRHRLGARPRPRCGAVRQLPAARCADQSGQLGRPDLQHGGPGDRRQHRHRLALRRLGRHRLRHAERTGQADRRPVARQRPHRARLARRLGGGLGTTASPSPASSTPAPRRVPACARAT